jgi:hypothetical protein
VPFFNVTSLPFRGVAVASPILGVGDDSGLTANPVTTGVDMVGNVFVSPQAVNASTDWGTNLSPSNNFGLGSGFVSSQVRQQQAVATSAAPSKWWIWMFILFVLVVL